MTTVVWPHRASPLMGMINRQSPLPVAAAAVSAASLARKSLRVVMAGGGTGGHLYPGLAVAAALEARVAAGGQTLQVIWAATPRSVDKRLLGAFGDNYIEQPVQPLVKSVQKIWPFLQGWRQSCSYWAKQFRAHKTDCVVALGGYAAGPAAYVAANRGIPVILLNPDALPGLANRFLLKRADLIITQWPLGDSFAAPIKAKVRALGCPIRPELTARTRQQAAEMLGLDPARPALVITGASLGAKTINDAFIHMLADSTIRSAFQTPDGPCTQPTWQIIHLAGVDQQKTVAAAYAKYPEVHARVIGYCDDMASIWAMADLAIARAGASTCAELTACGVPSILLPYPFHKDMHQRANAMALLSAGAAVIVDDAKNPETNAAAIKKVLVSLLYDDELRIEMADAARVAGKPAAADQIAQEILSRIAGSLR